MSIAVVILTYNEAMHIDRAIQSVAGLGARIYVIDSHSTDDTCARATALGATVLQNPFVNQAVQFNWALDYAGIEADWILRLDADEVLSRELVEEIRSRLPSLPAGVVGVNLRRRHIFMDRWVRHGGRYPLLLLRLWRRGHGRVEDRWMDEHVVISGGRTITFQADFADHNLNDLTYFVDKHNKYATREAIEILNQRLGLFVREDTMSASSASFQAAAKRFIKERLYNRIPFTLSALLYFLWRYVFQLGFLDGRSGLVYHFLQGYWYRFLVGAKVMELERAVAHLSSAPDIVRELSSLTGLKLKAPGSSSGQPG